MGMISLKYIAGFIDADGCITISKQSRRNRTTPQGYQAYLTAANTNEQVLRDIESWIRSKGANVLVRKYDRTLPRRTYFQLVVWGNELKKIMPELMPELRIKQEQAKLILEYLKTMPGGNRPIGEEVREIRRILTEKIQALNRGY